MIKSLKNELSFTADIPIGKIQNLRIDLGNENGSIIGIKSINIKRKKSELEFKDVNKIAESLVQLEKLPSHNNSSYFKTLGNDPSFQIINLEALFN
ncbi:hypothetical protein D3C86_1949150 [compost metagenome]